MKQYKITVIGLGLIGGSMAVDLKRRGFASRVMGVEADPVNAAAALKIGLVDQAVSYDRCLEDTDLVILAVPVGEAVRIHASYGRYRVFRAMGGDVRHV